MHELLIRPCTHCVPTFYNIVRDWAKDKVQKGLVEAVNRYKKQEEERKSRFFFRKLLEQSQSAVEQPRLSQTQNLS